MNVEFFVFGNPQGKARPRVVRRKDGRSMTYTPDKTVKYEGLVQREYIAQSGGDQFALDLPLIVTILAVFPVPKSESKKRKAQMLLGRMFPTKKPDLDNIAKIVCDALNGIAYADDSRIVSMVMNKEYGENPGVHVSIGVRK